MKKLFTLLSVIFFAIYAWAETDKIYYTSNDGNIVEPYKTDVFGANIISNEYKDGQGIITFDGPVTSIGNTAFDGCTSLTSITIPNSVTSIGVHAFYNCSSLTSIPIPESVTSIRDMAFCKCTSLTSITLGCGVTSIGEAAFSHCSSLISIIIPNSVTSIGSSAFSNCSSLISITIPNSVTSIGDWAFFSCSSLPSITIPESVTSIGDIAFCQCTSLTSITIPNSVTSMGARAFMGCSSLTSVAIGNSVKSIGEETFNQCTSLTSITIPNSVTSMGFRAFIGCSSLTSITLGSGVTSIGDEAFAHCSSLISIIIPNSVTSMGKAAFAYCTSLTSITIPESVTNIGGNVFGSCSSLTSVTLGSGVTSIGDEAFVGCSLNTIYLEATTPPTLLGANVFAATPAFICHIPCGTKAAYEASDWAAKVSEFVEECTVDPTWQILYTSTDGNIVTPYKTDVFGANIVNNEYKDGQGVITFDGPVTSIGDSVFHNQTTLVSITLPNSVTSIGESAFWGCDSLTSFTIPNSVKNIKGRAFFGCHSLTSISIPNSVISIGEHAFTGCTSLTSITIPNSVTNIEQQAFWYCTSLTSIAVEPNNLTYDSRENCNALIETSTNTLITGCQNTFIPNSVTSIGDYAFDGCKGLISITIPSNVTSIGNQAFDGCSNLTSITIPNSVRNIGEHAFANCYSLTSITIPSSTTEIKDCAYYNCSGLTSITIPSSVNNIGIHAFSHCTGLTTIICKATTPPNLGYEAFFNIPESTTLIIPCGTKAAYEASDWKNYVSEFVEECTVDPTWQILYTSTDGNIVEPNDSLVFGANIVTNEYKDGQGIITFDGPVKSIGDTAFYRCYSLASITIPNSVESIGKKAFHICHNLTSITIPNSVISIGYWAFGQCYDLISISIPNSVTSIGEGAFAYCNSLASITIPDGVTSIGKYAFNRCESLTSISIPKSVTSIGKCAFSNCDVLTSMVVESGNTTYDSREGCNAIIETATNVLIAGCKSSIIPNSVTSIGECAFGYCRSLTSITIPNSVTSIGFWAFGCCSSLTSVTIPEGVISIGGSAFSECSSLTSITCKATTPPALSSGNVFPSELTTAYIPCGTKAAYEASDWAQYVSEFIEECPTQKCGDNLYWTFADSTLTITGTGAMYDFEHTTQPWSAHRTAINKVELPDGITHIGEHAFAHCDTLLSINMPNSITSIGAYAFGACEEMSAITLPQNLTQIGDSAFAYCFSLQEITLPQGLISTGKSTFYGCINLLQVSLPNSLTIIGENAFSYCRGLYSINLPNNLTNIGDEAFANCDNLTAITIPESVTSLGWSTFINCRALRTVELPSSLKSIGEFVFEGCSLLENITLPNSVSSIGKYAFYFCVSLPTITIPESVKTIGEFAFSQCVRLDTIYAESNTPAAIQSSTFNNYNVPLVVPCVARETYKNDSIWGKFKNIMCIYNVVETVDSICPGETYTWTWNGQAYTDSGIYRDTVGNDIGLLELIVRPAIPAVHVYHNSCDPYTWNGTTYDKSGEYTYVCPGAYGCDSTTILHLYIPVKQYKEETITACESYDWKGTTYTSSGDYVHTTPSALGCDSIVETLHLTINHIDYVDIYETACDSYTWNGITYTTSGTHNFVYTNINGCDSIVTLHLTINQSQEMEEFVTACDIYTWHGQTYTTSGTYYYNTTGANGCNLRYILHLTINNTQHIYETQVACNSYEWHGQTYTTSGDYTYTTTGGNGCNLVYHLNLTINTTKYAEVTETACDSYTWNGQTYTTSGDYTYTTTGSNGCDSITTLHLTIHPISYNVTYATGCGSYHWNGKVYTVSGFDVDTLINIYGCDSIDCLVLAIHDIKYAEDTVVACDSYTWNGQTYTTSGDYTYTTTGSNGCDSICTLHLTINNSTHADVTVIAKNYYTWNGTTYTNSGDYSYTTTGSNGCDSITTLHLIICKEEFKTILDTICDGEEYIDPITNQKHIISSLVPETQTWKDTVHVSATLDTIYTFHITPIVAPEKMTDNLIHTLNAEPWLVPGTLPDTTGTTARILAYYDMHDTETIADVTNIYWSNAGLVVPCGATEHTMTLVVEAGCNNRIVTDHIIDVIPMLPSLIPVDSAIICHGNTYLWPANNQTYSTTGLHAGVVANQYGCDSTIYLYLEVLPEVVYTPTEKATICYGESYRWSVNNQDYTTKGTHTHVVKNSLGCDSIIYTLELTVLPPVKLIKPEEVTICFGDSYTWSVNNKTYTTKGSHTHVVKNVLGCDSILYTLRLTILPDVEYRLVKKATICYGETYTWSVNNQDYATSGIHTHVIKNSLGCDSIIYTLELTVLPDVQVMPTQKATICYGESYRWSVNNQDYTTKGTHTHVVKNVLGCDSIIYTLDLTVLPKAEYKPVNTATVCHGETYTWTINNKVYNQAGTYYHTIKNSLRCDSIIYTLDLTVLPKAEYKPTMIASVCHGETYTWTINNKVYNQAGTYYHIIKNSLGCDSIVYTLDLTVLPDVQVMPTQKATICYGESYRWSVNNKTYATKGTHTHVVKNSLGCDSIIYTLELAILPPLQLKPVEKATICYGETYTWSVNNQDYATSGYHSHVVKNSLGCDSILYTLNLTVLPDVQVMPTEKVTICHGETYTWSVTNKTYTTTGYLNHVVKNSLGCDSIIYTLDLTILPEVVYHPTEHIKLCDGETYYWSRTGQYYDTPGVYTYTISNHLGCDSIIYTLNYETQKVSYEYETATICNNGAFFWVVTGKEYNKGGTYHYTLQNAWGCDSIYYTLEVTELPSVPVIYISDTICGGETYFFNGVPLTETNRYYLHTNSNSGCDSTVILDLTVLPEPTYIDKEVLVCQGETYRTSWGQTLNKPGHYSKTISSAWGCDSIVHSVVFDYYQQTMPDHITYPVAIVGLPIDVTAAEADIQSHIDYEGSWYAPNAEITWLIRQDGQWAQLTTDPVEKNIVQLEMMYTITTDCGTTSSDILVVPVLLTGIDSPEVHGQGAQKFFYDGRLYILREGKLYNAQGAVIEM